MSNGPLIEKGMYKNGKRDGYWEVYTENGAIWNELMSTYRNGVKVSD